MLHAHHTKGVYIIALNPVNTKRSLPIEFDKRYMLDKTNISVIYSDSHISLEGDSYVMLFNQGYHQLVEKLPGRLVKFFIELSFDVMKDTGNLVKINSEFYREKYAIDTVTMYQYVYLLKKHDLLRKVKGMSKVYALNPKVCWRRSLKERKVAMERWESAREDHEPPTAQQEAVDRVLADMQLTPKNQKDQNGILS